PAGSFLFSCRDVPEASLSRLASALKRHAGWNHHGILLAAIAAAALLGDVVQCLQPAAAPRKRPGMHPLGMTANETEDPEHPLDLDGVDQIGDLSRRLAHDENILGTSAARDHL